MKNSKKIVALVLAMVMIFALTASALAATNTNSVTVKVTVKGLMHSPTGTNPDATEEVVICTLKPITSTRGNTVYDVINTMNDLHAFYGYDPVWKTVKLTDSEGTPAGGTAQALISLSNTVTTDNGSEYPDYTYNTWASTNKTTQTYDGSVFQCYKYVYTGYDWVYTVNGNTIGDKYMDQYVLSDGDQIELIYQYQAKAWERYIIS